MVYTKIKFVSQNKTGQKYKYAQIEKKYKHFHNHHSSRIYLGGDMRVAGGGMINNSPENYPQTTLHIPVSL